MALHSCPKDFNFWIDSHRRPMIKISQETNLTSYRHQTGTVFLFGAKGSLKISVRKNAVR